MGNDIKKAQQDQQTSEAEERGITQQDIIDASISEPNATTREELERRKAQSPHDRLIEMVDRKKATDRQEETEKYINYGIYIGVAGAIILLYTRLSK